jgi:hypothetical protein
LTQRLACLVAAAAIAATLVATSPPRIVGDGVEYVSQALNFSHFSGPSFGRREMRDVEARVKSVDPRLADWSLERATIPGRNRNRDFQHFWFYGLVATPFLWLSDAAGAHPVRAFTALNCSLLLTAVWIVVPRIGATTTTLLFLSPIIWWIDKPHTEVFTVSLLAMAFALVRERPGWAMALAGLAATQNSPIAVVVPILAIIAVRQRGVAVVRHGPTAAGAAVGLIAAALQPAYLYATHGTPSLLLAATIPGIPSLAEVAVVPFDLNVGLIVGFPALMIATVIATIRLARRHPAALLTADIAGAAAAGAVFLIAFASTANLHHGATPGITRYALWLIPLTIPLLAHGRERPSRAWSRTLGVITFGSVLFSVMVYHPAQPENWTQPTRLSEWLWTHRPAWSNPMPEIFAETLRRDDRTVVPTATRHCEKIVLGNDVYADGVWPVPCAPVPLPAFCSGPDALCYANRTGAAYSIVPAPGRRRPVTPDGRVWPRSAEARVLAWYNERNWWPLLDHVGELDEMRAALNVRATPMGTAARFVVTLERPANDATLSFRLPAPMRGEFLDPITGQLVGAVRFDGPAGEMFATPVPPGHDVLILEMTGVPN